MDVFHPLVTFAMFSFVCSDGFGFDELTKVVNSERTTWKFFYSFFMVL